jgi:hypothetical protein
MVLLSIESGTVSGVASSPTARSVFSQGALESPVDLEMEYPMSKAVLIAAALVLAPLALSSQEVQDRKDREPSYVGKNVGPNERADDKSPSSFRDSVGRAIDTVMEACSADIDDFCGTVTSGGGRVSLCMLAHEDQLSGRCRSALYRVSRELKRNVDRVAGACWGEIQTLCGDAGKIGQCLEQKRGSLSSSCQTIVGTLGQRVHRLMALLGMPVYSSDSKNLGLVVEVIKGPDEKLQSIRVDIGRVLGLGTKVVTITADKLESLPGIKVLLSEAEVRALSEDKK